MEQDSNATPVQRGACAEGLSNWLGWQTTSVETLTECKIFAVNKITATSKCGANKIGSFFTINCGDWVNIIAVTDDGMVLMVEQFRHGIQALTLEIPGGSVDSDDIDAQTAAERELREETGFIAESWTFLGKTHPNPALQDNLCYTFLAQGIRQIEAPKFDSSGTEKINTLYVKLSEIGSLIRDGSVTHALVITAFHFLSLEKPEMFAAVQS